MHIKKIDEIDIEELNEFKLPGVKWISGFLGKLGANTLKELKTAFLNRGTIERLIKKSGADPKRLGLLDNDLLLANLNKMNKILEETEVKEGYEGKIKDVLNLISETKKTIED